MGDLLNLIRKEPSEALLIGRRALEAVNGVELLHDFRWDPLFNKWVLFAALTVDTDPHGRIPVQTKWYIHVDNSYPQGEIEFFPATDDGISLTFPHQNYNGDTETDRPWRKGKICLDPVIRVFGRTGYDFGPHDEENRLVWHFERAKAWILAASRDSLQSNGDPFELPQFRTDASSIIAFSESPTTFDKWNESSYTYGLVEFVRIKDDPKIFVTKSFKTLGGREVYKPKWGKAFSVENANTRGLWIKLNAVPVIDPWKAPMSWHELCQVCNSQGIDLMEIIKNAARLFRDGRPHYVLLGFPIPEKVGELPCIRFWQAFQLPVLSSGNRVPNGFRKGEKGYWYRDRTQILRGSETITWIHSENWHRNEIFNRGKLPPGITNTSILQIGVGALGSVVAEQLVRADVQNLTLMDGDKLHIGNLTRHTLGLLDLKDNKAEAVAKRLNQSVPHSNVNSISGYLPCDSAELLNQYQVILDCTGEDDVLFKLEKTTWKKPKTFISASLGFAAKRLFIYCQKGDEFSTAAFFRIVKPWLERERESYDIEEMPREGIGCWHPVFPARIDDIWMMSGIVIKSIEKFIQSPPKKPTLLVYEQKWQNGFFHGVELVYQEDENE